MKINKFFAAAIAATTLLASCSKEETGNTKTGDDRRVQIAIDRSASNETRAIGGQVEDETDVNFTGGFLLFTNSADIVTLVVTISNDDEIIVGDATGVDKLVQKYLFNCEYKRVIIFCSGDKLE